jgi:hypothetical protein
MTTLVLRTVIVALLAGALAGPPATTIGVDESTSTAQCVDRDRVGYEPVSASRVRSIKLERLSFQDVEQRLATGSNQSPHATGRLVVEAADMTKDGPWSTTVYAVTDSPHRSGVKMVFVDHGSGGVRPTWVNEKLVFVQVWWGRIRSSDLIVDVPNAEFVYKEDADYITTILPHCDTQTPR